MFRFVMSVFVGITLSACSTFSYNTKEIGAGALGELSNSQISYNPARCQAIKNQCVQGHFEEFPTSDGQTGCACSQ
ncbi:hypothetical protein [Neptunicella sp.]|uniref:hypothetical protein n=1 Tax=Neptunicella sp. TaxID=2125986 RepID=UPI003F68DF35